MAKKKGTRKIHRTGSASGKQNVKSLALNGAGIVGGAIGGAILSNMIPVADLRMKAAGSILIGMILAGTNIIKGPIAKMAALGMVAGGSLSLLRRVLPNVPMLAGEEIDSLEYSGVEELEYTGEDLSDLEGEGEYSDIEQAGEDTMEMEGSIEELTGQVEISGVDSWQIA